jgi:hypothetical protein
MLAAKEFREPCRPRSRRANDAKGHLGNLHPNRTARMKTSANRKDDSDIAFPLMMTGPQAINKPLGSSQRIIQSTPLFGVQHQLIFNLFQKTFGMM